MEEDILIITPLRPEQIKHRPIIEPPEDGDLIVFEEPDDKVTVGVAANVRPDSNPPCCDVVPMLWSNHYFEENIDGAIYHNLPFLRIVQVFKAKQV